ncbi:ZZ type zinc finger domain-containing protein [Rutstroemia sp. NJR-2017a WRK4]|nr:ZZ type zinc finger domain-containing protein [Rutstroemia sp. NJR-2017a WRK4]
MASTIAPTPDTLVTLKINFEGSNRRFKLPLRELIAETLPDKLRYLLAIPSTSEAIFERYSDSAAAFIVLDSKNPSVYKQLYRAAKAKLKLRLKVTVKDKEPTLPKPATVEDEEANPVSPIDEQPAVTTTEAPAQAVEASQQFFNAPETGVENSPPAGAKAAPYVAEMQKNFEQLLVSHPRYTSASSCCSPPKAEAHSSAKAFSCHRGAAARDQWFSELASAPSPVLGIFSVYCNNCNEAIPDEHYHCSTCDGGDFDLCPTCVNAGFLCGGENHWLIKRFVKNGKVINSTTETIAPKPQFSESKTTLVAPEEEKVTVPTRTCNSCIAELAEDNFVTCTTCDDYDLCVKCHVKMEHGHHPKHAFSFVSEETNHGLLAQTLLAPGRNTAHNAICDGCDKYIYGVRHKCLDCPDWDYCSACIANASFIHPRHRFVPLYEPISDLNALCRSYSSKPRHTGIFCDGPLCNANGGGMQTYITGDRYKCAVCHDTDFCASCEASPSNPHNKTHPLIKFKTPVRNVSVTTLGDHPSGKPMKPMGDRRPESQTTSKSTETTPAQSANAATQVQTVAEVEPTEPVKAEEPVEAEEPQVAEAQVEEVAKELPAPIVEDELVAHFVRDAVADGTIFAPNTVFEQTWYLRNGGKTSWPAGCSVRFVGGDNMCAVDPEHPASVHELVSASESTTCYTEVAPGQESGFTVLMRTPSRAGNFISYWRLTTPTGDKFGHRLWCDVTVNEPTPVVKEAPLEEIKEEVKEEPKEEVEVEVKEEVKDETEPESSQMIFPKLEKESPSSSVHQEAPAPVAAPVAEEIANDDFEDFVADSIAADETDDGFMTDEEYDILDASDEEYLAERERASK